MGMRSGFRRLAGRTPKGQRIEPGMQRTIVYIVGAIVIAALIFGLSQR